MPKTVDKTHLEKTFVGREVAELMVDLKKQASEWLAEWKKPVQETASPDEPYYADEWNSDQIPF
jgi:hypothetical protein